MTNTTLEMTSSEVGNPVNILIVDDSDIIRRMIARTIEMSGLPLSSIHEAANGREALSVLDRTWIDVVLADLNMPIMGGLELLDRTREDAALRDIPVIVVSTESCEERVDELEKRGVHAVVRKPFRPEQIRDVLLSITDRERPAARTDALGRAVDEVLPLLTFMNAIQLDAASLAPSSQTMMHARMGFSGSVSGILSALVPFSLARTMSENALGEPSSSKDADMIAGDTVGELLNTLAGTVVSDLGNGAAFDLAPPEVGTGSATDWADMQVQPTCAAFEVEGHTMLLNLNVR